jgi:hypothetical protein
MRTAIAAVPAIIVAGYLALAGSDDARPAPHRADEPAAQPPIASVVAVPAAVMHATERAHAAAVTARAAAATREARAGSAQVRIAADAHAAVALSLDGLLEILVQELDRSAVEGTVVELRDLEISLAALADLTTELEGMADIRVTDSSVTIIGASEGARVQVQISDPPPER